MLFKIASDFLADSKRVNDRSVVELEIREYVLKGATFSSVHQAMLPCFTSLRYFTSHHIGIQRSGCMQIVTPLQFTEKANYQPSGKTLAVQGFATCPRFRKHLHTLSGKRQAWYLVSSCSYVVKQRDISKKSSCNL